MGDPAWEVNAISDTPFLREASISCFNCPSPPMITRRSWWLRDGRECLGEMLDAFLPAQTADVADEGRAVVIGGGDGEDGKVEEVLAGDEDFCGGRV